MSGKQTVGYVLLRLTLAIVLAAETSPAWQLGAESDSRAMAQTHDSRAEQARYQLAADYSRQHRGLAVLVLKADRVVFEQYDNGHSASTLHRLASGTKSFWGILAVAAADDGLLTLDERVANTIPEWRSDPRKAQITIRQLLNFTDGIEPAGRTLQGVRVQNKFEYAIALPATHEPGSTFEYDGSHLYIFGELMRRKLAARGKNLTQYLEQRLLQPIGLNAANWRRDGAGNPEMPAGLSLTARQWAQFGTLIKNRGQWNGRAIVSSTGLAVCFVGSAANPAYGLTFWLNRPGLWANEDGDSAVRRGVQVDNPQAYIYQRGPRDLVMAAGAGKQRLYVMASQDLVVVRQGNGGPFSDAEFLARLLDGRTD